MADNYYKMVENCQIPGLNGIFQGIFGQKADGMFVEVGAFDGHEWSNTFGLAEIGWAGLCIEPVHEFYERCVGWHKYHPKVVCSEAFVSDSQSRVSIYKSGDTYTGSKELAEALGSDGDVIGYTNTTTLDILLPKHNIQPFFELLVIDVEGFELEVLNGFTMSRWYPKMIIIEAHTFHENPVLASNSANIYSLLASCGYRRIYADYINDIYVRWDV